VKTPNLQVQDNPTPPTAIEILDGCPFVYPRWQPAASSAAARLHELSPHHHAPPLYLGHPRHGAADQRQCAITQERCRACSTTIGTRVNRQTMPVGEHKPWTENRPGQAAVTVKQGRLATTAILHPGNCVIAATMALC
jgi:hypothetical protein